MSDLRANSLVLGGDAGPEPRWGTITELLGEAADRYGPKEFLRFSDGSLSFADTEGRSGRLAQVLAGHGIRAGDRVAIMMDNVTDWPLAWLAVLKAGAIAVPVNPRYRQSDLAFVLRDSGTSLVLAAPPYADLVREVAAECGTVREVCTPEQLAPELAGPGPGHPLPRPGPSDVTNFQYTSGTTGFPKACMLTHDYWLRIAWLTAIGAELRSDDVVLMAQAFSYMDPQWCAVMCLIGGLPMVVLPRFSASGFWASVREHGATVTYVLGTMPLLMAKQPAHPLDRENRMRLVLCSGIAPALHRRFEERWGAPWRELYGSTESGLDLIVPPDAGQTVGTGAMGRPPAGKQAWIADENGRPLADGETGEILIRGKPMMTGYWNHPQATADAFRGGWFHTGDLGYRDPEGWIHHAGRLKDMVRRGGANISSAEVESILAEHPAVVAAALVPIPDDLFGELPKAFVQLRPGHPADTETAMSVLDHARRHLADFKVPAYLEFVDSFPMTPSARIRKRDLLQPERDQRAGAFEAASRSWT
jgi:acyl-CoA synthetase (AMP-forming)/AMP-acid ligase II